MRFPTGLRPSMIGIGACWLCGSFLAAPVTAQACISGPPVNGLLGGDLGPAPGGAFVEVACLEIRDDSGVARSGEIVYSGILIPRTLGLLDTGELAIVGPGDRRLAAQLDVLSRWGGTVDDPALPIRWLQVVVPAEVAPEGTARYSLRHYPGLAAATDPYAAFVTDLGGGSWRVDTGLASFTLDAANPALIQSIAVDLDDDGAGGKTTVYTHVAGAGPRLVYDGGAGDVILDTGGTGEVVVDAGGFEIVESGPVKAVVAMRGHFVDPVGMTSRCTAGGEAYEALGFTAAFTFVRGSRDLGIQVEIRNECSDAMGGNWMDDVVTLREAAWSFPFTLADQTSWVGGDGALSASAAGFAGVTEVEQRRGAGTAPDFTDWTRRARARRDGTDLEAAEAFDDPMIAVSDTTLTVAAQMPWMRYREPQGLRVDETTLSLRFVSEDLRVGEGKGIWGFARVSLTPTALATADQSLAQFLEQLRGTMKAELERGLVPWPGRGKVNAARAFPSLGTGAAHSARTAYLDWLDTLHAETVDPGAQWDRNKTFGSQYWPETGSNDPFGVDADFPNQSTAGMNYWDPAGAEALEFLATGDPAWLWDFSLMGYWVQMFSAYLNTGFHFFGNRNGLAVESGGPGCPPDPNPPFVQECTPDGTGGGHWHRSGGGSDDYSYAMSMELGYALRPNLPMRDRFGQAGQTVRDRYDTAIPEADREQFVNVIEPNRQVIQHFEMLANCAEFVPGTRGQDCHDRLLEVVGELARDNLAAGILCTGNTPNGEILGPPEPLPTQCFTPQQFMQNALMYQFLHRLWSSYGHLTDPATQTTMQAVRRALVEAPRGVYEEILDENGGNLVVGGDWPSALDCTMDASGTMVTSCESSPDGEGNDFMYLYNQPHTATWFLVAHDLDPSLDYCQSVKAAWDDPFFTGGPGDGGNFDTVSHFNFAGWWKGVSQMVQGMPFGLGLYDVCADDPDVDLAVTKTNGVESVTAGDPVTYEVTVTNNGPRDVAGAVLTDVLDGAILDLATASFTCAPLGPSGDGTVCPLDGDDVDLAAGVTFDLEAGDSVRFTVQANVRNDAAGTLENTATVAPPAGVTDPTPGNDSATDSDPVGTCAANDFETVTGTLATTQVVEACVRIDADAVVPDGVSLTLHAPLVRLDPGFRVEAGGSLTVIGGLPVQ